MASNFQGWLEPSGWEDDAGGSLSSLERRQRKQAEKQDIHSFYSSLGFLFFIITGLLLWSEVYSFASHPSRALTGAFVLECFKFGSLAWNQLASMYNHIGHLAFLANAVVFGPDFIQRGGSVTHGAATLLSKGLFYLATVLSGESGTTSMGLPLAAPLETAVVPLLMGLMHLQQPPPQQPLAQQPQPPAGPHICGLRLVPAATALGIRFANSAEPPQPDWQSTVTAAKQRMHRLTQTQLSAFGRCAGVSAYALQMNTYHWEHGGMPPGDEATLLEGWAAGVGFLHGKTSHLCVCRRCAAQLREGVHRCPMCRQLIERIIDIF
ncbi:hypothetical protein TSOC_008600 [Tetrabaena socialis]|uniref:Uncharacterized protein n=1 Tax=Tetrabaena socialis TaxID=47790 RepID=A0A2J7ZY25_9CHLO|nr:hypothetical protein TSOC_008600 [Tetrabaena socialis]|eukprot:PNH05168.1 hypothetical protein TSOC_008600 [Tetrabaena socialis]